MKTRTLAAAAVLAVSPAVAIASPAHALGSDNIGHYSPDAGQDTSFTIKCNNGNVVYLAEGHNSWDDGKCGPNRAYSIYVHQYEDIACLIDNRDGYGKKWTDVYNATGWHVFPGNFDEYNYGCVSQFDD